ncbi:MAG TPA: chemotaxis response regulator protein-glutamate methylesterase [Verrucomicrobiales bacterium]|nr:chemotaxis response regulator protein-glutamate methylesterase [Verrucomicrobiales bacterium]
MNTTTFLKRKIRVLVVDDSAIARKIITESLAGVSDIEVVGTAVDPYNARDQILKLSPDVLTLDIEMPKMDGLTFLRLIMQHKPMPVIIMSSLTTAGSAKAMEALEAGAVDVMDKPRGSYSAYDDGSRLAAKIRAAACARLRRSPLANGGAPATPTHPNAAAPAARPGATTHITRAGAVPTAPRPNATVRHFHPRKLILIGASTGGPEALNVLMRELSGDLPGICIVQHIPACFSKALADRLNRNCRMEVREAVQGDVIKPGLAIMAPGGYHMLVRWTGSHYSVDLNQGPPLHHQRPAVDVLFDTAVKAGAGPHVTAALLTGMGADGAAGLLKLKEAGATTIAQDEESCVVFGMPKEAIKLGAAQHILPLQQIARKLEQFVTQGSAAAAKAA